MGELSLRSDSDMQLPQDLSPRSRARQCIKQEKRQAAEVAALIKQLQCSRHTHGRTSSLPSDVLVVTVPTVLFHCDPDGDRIDLTFGF